MNSINIYVKETRMNLVYLVDCRQEIDLSSKVGIGMLGTIGALEPSQSLDLSRSTVTNSALVATTINLGISLNTVLDYVKK